MQLLLKLARAIDAINIVFGRIASWLVLLACAVSAANAASRYALDLSSNAWLELQWYMFAGMVMLGAPFVLNVNGHVRVDVFYGRSSPRRQVWIDLTGLALFVLPVMIALMVMSWPFFVESYLGHEISGNAGGLLRWPVKLIIPAGFGLMVLQGIAEVIKRIGFLLGLEPGTCHRRYTTMSAMDRLETLRAMLAQDPSNLLARYGLATELKNAGRGDEAVAEFKALLEMNPNYSAAYYHAGRTLESMGRIDEAREMLEKGVEATTRNGDAHTRSELQAALDLLGI